MLCHGHFEFTELAQCLFTWSRRKTNQQVFLYDSLAANIERLLQTSENINHLLIVFARVTAVYLIDEECHTHLLQLLSCSRQSVLQVKELLDIYNNNTDFTIQRCDERISVNCFHEHRLVNVHVHHHGIQLVTQLQPVNNYHHLIIG